MTNEELKELAPHGWDNIPATELSEDVPYLAVPRKGMRVKFYIPAKPRPREWEGTVGSLNGLGGPTQWGDYTRIKVVEVL